MDKIEQKCIRLGGPLKYAIDHRPGKPGGRLILRRQLPQNNYYTGDLTFWLPYFYSDLLGDPVTWLMSELKGSHNSVHNYYLSMCIFI